MSCRPPSPYIRGTRIASAMTHSYAKVRKNIPQHPANLVIHSEGPRSVAGCFPDVVLQLPDIRRERTGLPGPTERTHEIPDESRDSPVGTKGDIHIRGNDQ